MGDDSKPPCLIASLPLTIQHALVVRPASDLKGIPGTNKRRRKQLQKNGFVTHLFAGPDKDFTLRSFSGGRTRCWKASWDRRRKRAGSQHARRSTIWKPTTSCS